VEKYPVSKGTPATLIQQYHAEVLVTREKAHTPKEREKLRFRSKKED